MSDANKPPRIDIMRSPARPRARPGLRAGRAPALVGATLTAIALVPLTLWFICGMVRLVGATRARTSPPGSAARCRWC